MKASVDQPAPVREGEQLDLEKLRAYLRQQLDGALDAIDVRQFPSGYSNLTYSVRAGREEWVLRRPPLGNQVKSAHDMSREYRVLRALHPVFPRAPKPVLFCDDESVLGTQFYLMHRVEGLIIRRDIPRGLSLDPRACRELCQSFVKNLAELHSIDYAKAGLGDLGKPEGFVQRQVAGWISRYQKAATESIDAADEVAEWLAAHNPPDSATALIHNDYKFDNLVLDPVEPTRIIGVLDWEMCTLGDPMMDLGSAMGYWVEAGDSALLREYRTGPTDQPGFMTRRELYEYYAECMGRQLPEPLFYYVYGLFKLAVISQQIYRRYVQGQTRDPRFAPLGQVVRTLCEAGRRVLTAQQI